MRKGSSKDAWPPCVAVLSVTSAVTNERSWRILNHFISIGTY
ncbi:hypothetical protein AKJ16_DCAP08827 [Drosera capensis]